MNLPPFLTFGSHADTLARTYLPKHQQRVSMQTVFWTLVGSGLLLAVIEFIDQLLVEMALAYRNNQRLAFNRQLLASLLLPFPMAFIMGLFVLPTLWWIYRFCRKFVSWSWTSKWPTK
jgi:hypothetical protein